MKRLAIGAAIALLLAAAAMSAYWAWAAHRFGQAVAQTAEDLRAQGYQVAYLEPQVTGFPFDLNARLEDGAVERPGGPSWRGPTIDGRLWLLDPTRIEIAFPGDHKIATAREVIDASFVGAEAEILLDGSFQPAELHTELVGIVLSAEGRPEVTAAGVLAQLGPWQAATADQLQTIDLRFQVSDLGIPPGQFAALGRIIESLSGDVTLHGPLRGGNLADALVLWRADGGHLEVRVFALTWGPLSLVVKGDLALDPQGRPKGQLMVQASGLPETLDLLEQAQLLKPDQLKNARTALKAYAKIPGQSEQQATFPLNLKQGRVFLGFLPLGRLSPVL
ncbi:MAG: DUF2125 domain-containing protein [Pseudomonadota bacterium]